MNCLWRKALLLVVLLFPALAAPAIAQTALGEGSQVVQDPNYRFGPEDVIQITVWGRPDLTGAVVVDTEGRIEVPLVGEVLASGRTSEQLAADLLDRYQLVDPSVGEVRVNVAQYNAITLTILGEVRSGGQYGFREMPDLIEALLTAGGPTPAAELALVQIVRFDPAPGEPRTVMADLSRGLDKVDPSALPTLQPKDRILVPSTEDVPVGGDRIHVLGAVRAPGVYRFVAAQTVVDAISASGGFTPDAALSRVYLTRVTSMGAVSYQLDIEGYLKKAEPLSNMELMPGDTLTIMQRRTFWDTFARVLGLVLPIASLTVTLIVATNR